MAKVGIATDTVQCLPPEIIKEFDIRMGSVNLVIDGKSYRDQVDVSNEQFFAWQKNLKEMPTTTGVNPADFADIFRDLAKSTQDIICLPHSGGLGVTYDSALQARDIVKEEMPGVNIEVIDTKTAAGAQGLIVLEAARAAQAGKSLSEIIAVIENMIPRVKWVSAVESLKYLIKGGRAPKYAGKMADLIGVKPIFGMMKGTGKVDYTGRVRTKPKSLTRLIQIAKENIQTGKPVHAVVHYTDSLEDGEKFRDMVASEFNCVELYMTPWTPVMCCHSGPMIGLCFYSE
ncbi:DegV family protein [Chloroflexota bacterium]